MRLTKIVNRFIVFGKVQFGQCGPIYGNDNIEEAKCDEERVWEREKSNWSVLPTPIEKWMISSSIKIYYFIDLILNTSIYADSTKSALTCKSIT